MLEALDQDLTRVADAARILPALSATDAARERPELVRCLERGERPMPRVRARAQRVEREVYRALDRGRRAVEDSPLASLYLPRFEELELELSLLEHLGEARHVRPLSARRYGTGDEPIQFDDGPRALVDVARSLLASVEGEPEPRTIPARASGRDESAVRIGQRVAARAHLDVRVQVEPRLLANAAAGERTMFLADRWFGAREAHRLAVHEVLGHLVAAVNGRLQPLGILRVGTAGSFADQEGLAVHLEAASGLMDGHRMRILAGRVVATQRMHAGATFGETAMALHREYGFSADDAIILTERAYRGGGVARDAVYLRAWIEVRNAIQAGQASVDALRMGRVSLRALPLLVPLREVGLVRAPAYTPSLARSLGPTALGTSFDTSPPSLVTSLQSPDAT